MHSYTMRNSFSCCCKCTCAFNIASVAGPKWRRHINVRLYRVMLTELLSSGPMIRCTPVMM